MPLIQSASKEALQKNIATEIKAGKDPKQAAAIAYSVQRENDKIIDSQFKFTVHYKNGETKDKIVLASNYQEAVRNLMTDPNVDSIDDIHDYAPIKDSYYTESEKKDKQFVKNAIEELEGYINNWNFLTARQKRDIGSSREQLKARVAELKQVKDSSIKGYVSKVENIGKFTLWQDNDTKEYYFDATVSRSGKKLYRLNTTDINKAREKVKKELEWISDSAIKDAKPYALVNRRDKILVYANTLEEARYLKSSYTKNGEYDVRIKELNSGRIVDMKNTYKVKYGDRSFIVRAKDKKIAAETIMKKVLDDGKLVSKYVKNVGGKDVTSAIIEHSKGYTFLSGIIKEDRDFNDLGSAESYAQRLGYIPTKDCGVNKLKDKNIPVKLKQELLGATEKFIEVYGIEGYIKLTVVDNKVIITSEIGYNMLDKLLNDLTNIINKYGSGATFDVAPDGKSVAVMRDKAITLKDTLEILETDGYKIILDGSWLEITTRNGETIYSGNTTAKSVREAYNMAKRQNLVDCGIDIEDANKTFKLIENKAEAEKFAKENKGTVTPYKTGDGSFDGFIVWYKDSAIKDSNLSNAYAELKKYYPNAQVSMTNKTLIVTNVNELGSGIKNFLTNLNKKYGSPVSGFGGRPTNEPHITNNEALLIIKDSAIKDSSTKDADYEQPKYRRGQKFETSDGNYEILGTKEVVADVHTGRKGIVYEIKDINKGYTFTQPCWELEKYVASGNYKLRDSKTYKVSYMKRTFLVDASSKKEAARKIINKLK